MLINDTIHSQCLIHTLTAWQLRRKYLPTPESHHPHRLGYWQKDLNKTLQIPNMIKSWLWLFHIQNSQKVLQSKNLIPSTIKDSTLGTFTISLIESLYIEANKPPLSLRRHKLAFQYYSKLISCLQNPAYNSNHGNKIQNPV